MENELSVRTSLWQRFNCDNVVACNECGTTGAMSLMTDSVTAQHPNRLQHFLQHQQCRTCSRL